MTENDIQVSDEPAHSPLGASSAERWMNCSGSVALIKALELPESDEEDWRRDGICAHEAAAHCLEHDLDAWEAVGMEFHEHKVDEEIAVAIQVYIDHCRPMIERVHGLWGQYGVETRIRIPEHRKGYGTTDFWALYSEPRISMKPGTVPYGVNDGSEDIILDVDDYKHGQGIVVDVDGNPQVLYYAYGVLARLADQHIDKVRLRIIQPRAFHPDGVIRTWETTPAFIRDWAAEELIPAMLRTEMDNDLKPGDWCRFCPAKLVCPVLTGLFGAAMAADPKQIVQFNDASLAKTYQYVQAVKFYLKALEEEVFRRLNGGAELEGLKLVHKRANRIWHDGAREAAIARFGDAALSIPDLKSPAEIEKLGTAAKAWVKEHAYTPESGLTVALEDDKRPGVKMRGLTATFKDVIANQE